MEESERLLPFAHASDLVRAHQKDEHCRSLLRSYVVEAVEEVAGHRRAASWQGGLVLASDAAYAVATAVLCGRTLGEEYCELLAVTTGLRGPSPRQRLAAAALMLLPPATLQLLVGALTSSRGARSGSARAALASWFGAAAEAAPAALRLHLALFYVFGAFRRLSDRAAGLRFISLSDRPHRKFTYRPLGALLALQLLGQALAGYLSWRRRRGQGEADGSRALAEVAAMSGSSPDAAPGAASRRLAAGDPDRQPVCLICYCPADCATSTPCGHLFCWDCIASWCAIKASCPLCRAAAPPQQLLPLCHYEVPPPPRAGGR